MKIVLTYCEKKKSSDREYFLKFLRSQDHKINSERSDFSTCSQIKFENMYIFCQIEYYAVSVFKVHYPYCLEKKILRSCKVVSQSINLLFWLLAQWKLCSSNLNQARAALKSEVNQDLPTATSNFTVSMTSILEQVEVIKDKKCY